MIQFMIFMHFYSSNITQNYAKFIKINSNSVKINFFIINNFMRSFVQDFPSFKNFFEFQEFNQVQQQCYQHIAKDDCNMIISAPTSSGKTVLFQLAILKHFMKGNLKSLYLAPIKSLCHEKMRNWQKKFHHKINIIQLTSDNVENDDLNLDNIGLTIATPQKIDFFSRRNLSYLSQIQLLLIDQIHMLNYEERGATLEAVISRIMSLSQPRIIAVSATIPNIYQVGQWLKVPKSRVKIFGDQYRPVPLQKVVLGFNSSNNPFTFEKMLNYKLLSVIRNYSHERGVLVFCQTQKGTESACHQLTTDMEIKEFVSSDQKLKALNEASHMVSNFALKELLPQGIAFHNASLTIQDRIIIEKLFLNSDIRVLCTTSTLAMGVNLPARLVVIKSTQTYKGSGKGYQEYSQIQIDQMMGRAGRIPFDTKGTVVIMTQKKHYYKYLNSGKQQNLQSFLYEQLSEHINAEISLRSLENVDDVFNYFHNSFCYIRMKTCPHLYNIKSDLEEQVSQICLKTIQKLASYGFINFVQSNRKIIPRYLGKTTAKNSINIDTIIHIVEASKNLICQKDFLLLICESEEIKKIRNKLDERKLLKILNEKIKYPLKTAVSTSEKKSYVLLQAELDGKYIESWQLRKQAKDLLGFFKRLLYCMKVAMQENKLFWPYYWSNLYLKFMNYRFWNRNEEAKIKMIPELAEKWKILSLHGIRTLDQVQTKIANSTVSISHETILQTIRNIKNCVRIDYEKGQSKGLIKIKFIGQFNETLKSIIIIVGNEQNLLYKTQVLNYSCIESIIAIPNKKHYLAIIKEGFIGFDEFYALESGQYIYPFDPQQFKQEIKLKKTDNKVKSNQKYSTKKQYSIEKKERTFSKPAQKNKEKLKISAQKDEDTRRTIFDKKRHPIASDHDFTFKKFQNRNRITENNLWKPGFPDLKNQTKAEGNSNKIMIIGSSKSKLHLSSDKSSETAKSKDKKIEDAYDYFTNLF